MALRKVTQCLFARRFVPTVDKILIQCALWGQHADGKPVLPRQGPAELWRRTAFIIQQQVRRTAHKSKFTNAKLHHCGKEIPQRIVHIVAVHGPPAGSIIKSAIAFSGSFPASSPYAQRFSWQPPMSKSRQAKLLYQIRNIPYFAELSCTPPTISIGTGHFLGKAGKPPLSQARRSTSDFHPSPLRPSFPPIRQAFFVQRR